MKTTHYAQIDAAGICFAEVESSAEIEAPHMIEVNGQLGAFVGKKWSGAAWVEAVPTEAEKAAAELAAVDAATGMGRTMREALLAIAGKVGAQVPYLAAQEAKAAAARGKLGA